MLSDEFWTLQGPGTAQTRVLGSRFFATAVPISNEADVQELLDQIKRQRFDASHHCWAFVCRADDALLERSSDAGEPKGTAGLPILHEIHGSKTENCAIVVTRWFGGTKLGTGGLVKAYGEAAAQALADAPRVKRRTGVTLLISAPFELQSYVYHFAGKLAGVVDVSATANGALLSVRLRKENVDEFQKLLSEATSGQLRAEVGEPWIS